MQSHEPVWMFNENTTRHRGVWHIIEGDLQVEKREGNTSEYKGHVYRNHTKSCQGIVYREHQPNDNDWYPTGAYKVKGCTCKYDTDEYEVIIGEYKMVHVTPEHAVVKAQPVLCHQTTIRGKTLKHVWESYRKKREDGQTYTVTDKIIPLHLWTGDVPPGPTCSRCEQAWEKQHAAE